MISIVLIEPENEGNIGAAARVMKNFGFRDLILIEPKCKIGKEATGRAKHAKDILKKVKVKDKDYLKEFDYLIGTTAKLGTDYNIPRSPIYPDELSKKLVDKKGKFAILFGREGKGLTNREILMCDFIVHIPATKKYPTLNMSHAVSIILYELKKLELRKVIEKRYVILSKKEKEQILKMINQILDKMEFTTKEKKEIQKKAWKRMIGKAMLTKREGYALMGFLRKLL